MNIRTVKEGGEDLRKVLTAQLSFLLFEVL